MVTDQPSRDAASAGIIPGDLAADSGSEVRRAHTRRRPGRGQEQVRAIPVTIVGGGIGGLSVALGLLDAGAVSSTDITIVDANPCSGRLHTYTGSLGHVCELGAGRYSPRPHPRLEALVTRFAIDVARIGERILLSTGAFTGNPGWIEGVLANASLLASELGETSRGRWPVATSSPGTPRPPAVIPASASAAAGTSPTRPRRPAARRYECRWRASGEPRSRSAIAYSCSIRAFFSASCMSLEACDETWDL